MSFEQAYESALAERKFGPGVVLMATDVTGEFRYIKEIGHRSWTDPQSHPYDQDTVVRLASCTKLMTSVAMLQCVERGLLSLDADIGDVVPDLRHRPIASFDADGKVQLTPSTKPITLRQMLNHTSGMSYHFFEPVMVQWMADKGMKIGHGRTLREVWDTPLTFEPGTTWNYGLGLDWAGEAVRNVTGLDLEDFMRQNIWEPLGITGITFFPHRHPELKAAMPDCCERDQVTGEVTVDEVDMLASDRDEPLGGMGTVARVADYVKFLQALLRDDGKLLKSEMMELLTRPSLNDVQRANLRKLIPPASRGIADDKGMDHGLGGVLSTDDCEGFRGANTLMWGGMPNLNWFVDRKRGLCGISAPQLVPSGDLVMIHLNNQFEAGIYQKYNEWLKGRAN